MPVRMEKDENRQQQPRNPGEGGGGLGKLLPFLLLFLFKKPKLIIPVLLIGAVAYFLTGGEIFNGLLGPSTSEGIDQSEFSLGFDPNPEEYEKRLVFASLAEGYNQRPARVSLLEYAPSRLNQGRQGSCVGWASGYAARTILHARQTGQDPNRVPFSPSYIYNQIAFEGCQGTYLHYAMETMQKQGALPLSEFQYNESSCRLKPSQTEQREASQYRIKGYERLSLGARNKKVDIQAIRQNLAAGAPVVIGMMVGNSFTHNMRGQQVWQPSRNDLAGRSKLGGHAMCVIGYDDNALNGKGAFQIMNSWGEQWGERGVAWVAYPDFEYFVKEAYGLYPMGESNTTQTNELAVELGLVNNATRDFIPLGQFGNNIFKTQRPIRKGDKFKLAVTNSVECYTYIFGMETDNSSYVLFPYTAKHSAYCGVTGTRLFPKDYSMVTDDLGNSDWLAIVVSKKPLDFEKLNKQFNQNPKASFPSRVNKALGNDLVPDVQFSDNKGRIQFQSENKDKTAVAMFVVLDKE